MHGRVDRHQHRGRDPAGQGHGAGPYHRDHSRRLWRALSIEAVQPAIPASEGSSRAGMAGAAHERESTLRTGLISVIRLRRRVMLTDCLFRENSYLKECSATVVGLTDAGGVMLDRTVFYAASGGQPADRGVLTTATGDTIAIANVSYTDSAKTEIAHIPAATTGLSPKIGEPVHAVIDWELRYARMRMHTALHLLSAVLPYPVTGGSVGDTDGRLDFDIPEAGLDKDEITRKLAKRVAAGAQVRSFWITDAELEAKPGLVKTMSVKPPKGTGRVRLIEIVGYDLQPCGGTHVRATKEIGDVRITQIEKKGKQNRRVRIAFA